MNLTETWCIEHLLCFPRCLPEFTGLAEFICFVISYL